MKKNEFQNISVISKSSIFEEKNTGTTHTAYNTETFFYSLIKNGEEKKIKEAISLLLSGSIVAGKLSDSEITQAKYWSVCCVTLATRYAVSGGLNENTAYNFSDETIYTMDKMNAIDEIFSYIKNRLILLTSLVKKEQENKYPAHINKCINYINSNLHEKLSVEVLAKECSLSEDYLSCLFKKSTGESLSSYILKKRLEQAKELLIKGNKVSDIAYYLNFCSESYFIKCFKEHFGTTPKKFLNQH